MEMIAMISAASFPPNTLAWVVPSMAGQTMTFGRSAAQKRKRGGNTIAFTAAAGLLIVGGAFLAGGQLQVLAPDRGTVDYIPTKEPHLEGTQTPSSVAALSTTSVTTIAVASTSISPTVLGETVEPSLAKDPFTWPATVTSASNASPPPAALPAAPARTTAPTTKAPSTTAPPASAAPAPVAAATTSTAVAPTAPSTVRPSVTTIAAVVPPTTPAPPPPTAAPSTPAPPPPTTAAAITAAPTTARATTTAAVSALPKPVVGGLVVNNVSKFTYTFVSPDSSRCQLRESWQLDGPSPFSASYGDSWHCYSDAHRMGGPGKQYTLHPGRYTLTLTLFAADGTRSSNSTKFKVP